MLYLIFNEGYSASAGATLIRRELTGEAIRLARLVVALMPAEPEALGLLSLLLIQDSRREARQGSAGELVLLGEQDRSRWDRARIEEGLAILEDAGRFGASGQYQLQAEIAAVHARAPRAGETDWPQIVGLYDLLLDVLPTQVVALNRAVAVAMAYGPEAGLAIVDDLARSGQLDAYHLLHSARAELLQRLARHGEARVAYTRAIDLAINDVDRRHLERRRADLTN